jgi:hypothetical protein
VEKSLGHDEDCNCDWCEAYVEWLEFNKTAWRLATQMKFFDYRNVYENIETGEQSTWLHGIVNGSKLVNDYDFNIRGRKHVQMMFENVILLPPKQVDFPFSPKKIHLSEFASKAFDIVCDAIEQEWNPDKIHIMPHSSGWDSNFISYALSHLREKNGDDWFGETIFVEIDGEHVGFYQIMARLGFRNTRVATRKNRSEIRAVSLNIEDAWFRTNGTPMPINIWFESFLQIDDDYDNMGDYQFIIGYGANEIKTCAQRQLDLNEFIEAQYYSLYSNIPLPPDCIVPFMSFDFIKLALESGQFLGDYRIDMLRQLTDKFDDVDRMSWNTKFSLYRKPAKWLLELVQSDYDNSWYGKNVKPNMRVPESLMPHSFWGHWALASLCEEIGYK